MILEPWFLKFSIKIIAWLKKYNWNRIGKTEYLEVKILEVFKGNFIIKNQKIKYEKL